MNDNLEKNNETLKAATTTATTSFFCIYIFYIISFPAE